MGSQSCVVVVGFVCLHIAFIVNIIALATPYWTEGHAANTTNTTNTNETIKGLWKICTEGDCQWILNTNVQEGKLKILVLSVFTGLYHLIFI